MYTETSGAKSPSEVIAAALLEYSGSGQGVDDMLVEIAQSQTSAIIDDLRAAGYIIVRHDAIRLAQAHAAWEAANDNAPEARKRDN